MTSTFGWLDTDPAQRRRMLEVVDLFKDAGSLDELGIGSIRDTLSDTMFPGTSTLHTRLRYVLFIPWLLQRAASAQRPEEMAERFRASEFALIDALKNGGEAHGVIGSSAGRSLKRLPSSVYWAALGTWGIRTSNHSAATHFRRASDLRHLSPRAARTEDGEASELVPASGIDPHLPAPPDRLLQEATFALRPEDEQYLSDRIAAATRGSLLAWLVHHPPAELPDNVWDLDLTSAPTELRDVVDHAHRFRTAIHGASVLYNLMLARKRAAHSPGSDDDAVAYFEDHLAAWRDEFHNTRTLEGWDRSAWWATIRRRNPRLNLRTQLFVDSWLDLIASTDDIASSADAHALILRREAALKGTRARLTNQSALDRWSGESGMNPLTYRWEIARNHLNDLYAAREQS